MSDHDFSHQQEAKRIADLERYGILDTLPENTYDNIVWLTANTLDVPIAAINFVDDQRQWSKACIGTRTLSGDRQHSFCAHVVHTRQTMVVPDARQDSRFEGNPFVTGGLGIQFYAGAPIVSSQGYVLGSLCAIDHQPRAHFPQREQETLERFAALVASELELRVSQRALEQTVEYAQATNARLQESEKRNKALLSAIPDTLVQVDGQGRVLSAKVGTSAPSAFHAEWPGERSLRDLLPTREATLVQGAVRSALTENPENYLELQIASERSVEEYEVRCTRVQDDEVLVMLRDISTRKQVERLQNEFVSTVSHELRTPLTSVRGSLSLIASGVFGELQPRGKRLVDIALNSSERLVRLINDILDIEKMESGRLEFRFQQVDLAALAEGSIEANRGYAHLYGVQLEFRNDTSDVPVQGDLDRLTQVLANLISNAVKFSPQGETVSVTLRREGERVRVSVRDRGPGVPQEFRDRIFRRFAQASAGDSRERGGTGLGLSISKAIIEQHGGTIGFHDHPKRGTVFFFELPVHEASIPMAERGDDRLKMPVCEDNLV